MDARPARIRAWEWVSQWRGTTGFWVAESLTGLGAGAIAYTVTNDWGFALAWFALGAIVAFTAAFVGRWLLIPRRDLQELREALAQGGEPQQEADREPGPDLLSAKFESYIAEQLNRLSEIAYRIQGSDSQLGAKAEWSDFLTLAWKIVSGIRLFDDPLGDYVTSTIVEAEQEANELAKSQDALMRLASRVIDTVADTPTLYSG